MQTQFRIGDNTQDDVSGQAEIMEVVELRNFANINSSCGCDNDPYDNPCRCDCDAHCPCDVNEGR